MSARSQPWVADWRIVITLVVGAALIALATPGVALSLVIAAVLALLAKRRITNALLALIVVVPWLSLVSALLDNRFIALGPDIALLGLLAACVTGGAARPQFRGRERLIATAILACLVIGIVEMINPRGLPLVDGMDGYRAFFLPMIGFFLAAVVAHNDAEFAPQLFHAIVLSIVLVALMGIRQAIAPASVDLAIIEHAKSSFLPFRVTGTIRLRAFSPLAGPFHFGLLMMLGILIVGARVLVRTNALHIALIGLFAVALALNATRLNWGGTAIGLVALAIVSRPKGLSGIKVLARIAMIFGVGGFLAFLLLQSGKLGSLQRFAVNFVSNPTDNTSYVYRVLEWVHDIIPAIRLHPIMGYGTGMAKDGTGPFSSHNVIFKILLEGGLLLAIPYLLAVGLAVVALWRRRQHYAARVALAAVVGVHAAGLMGPILDSYPGNLYFWMILGAALTLPLDDATLLPERHPLPATQSTGR